MDNIYTPREVAKILHCSYRLILAAIKDGRLESTRINATRKGGRAVVRITEAQLQRWMEGARIGEESEEEEECAETSR